MKPRSLVSVSDKRGLGPLGRSLADLGFEIVSTGGTARALRDGGVGVVDVADVTGTPEVLGGRVKTLHPRVFAAILADLDDAAHRAVLDEWRLAPFSLVVVNLYPFLETASRPGATPEDVVENIDIGGPSLLRAAAKNHRHVTVVVDPDDYPAVLESLRSGGPDLAFRRRLALKAFRHTAAYDAAIAQLLPRHVGVEPSLLLDGVAPWLAAVETPVRYGENPHQIAVLARRSERHGLAAFAQLQGKELSFNNLMDADAAWRLVHDLPAPGVAIVKHGGPCGVALDQSPEAAYRRALACDPVSAFGGVIASSIPLHEGAAAAIVDLFAEVVIAPGDEDRARAVFAGKKNLRVLTAPAPSAQPPRLRVIDGGLLVQSADEGWNEEWRVMTKRQPTEREQGALRLAWRVVKHAPSNAVIAADADGTLGIGAGQPSRVDSCRIAVEKARAAGLELAGAGAASDAFFPFPDGGEVLAAAGVTAVVQPGGSIRDADVVAAADRLSMTMVFTGRRHFRH